MLLVFRLRQLELIAAYLGVCVCVFTLLQSVISVGYCCCSHLCALHQVNMMDLSYPSTFVFCLTSSFVETFPGWTWCDLVKSCCATNSVQALKPTENCWTPPECRPVILFFLGFLPNSWVKVYCCLYASCLTSVVKDQYSRNVACLFHVYSWAPCVVYRVVQKSEATTFDYPYRKNTQTNLHNFSTLQYCFVLNMSLKSMLHTFKLQVAPLGDKNNDLVFHLQNKVRPFHLNAHFLKIPTLICSIFHVI